VPAARRGEVEAVLRQRLTAWTEEVDDYLAGVEAVDDEPGSPAPPPTTLGVGMYYFEDSRAGGTDR
jgi:hypothetical protein